jgi:hypothetical protein
MKKDQRTSSNPCAHARDRYTLERIQNDKKGQIQIYRRHMQEKIHSKINLSEI